MNRTVDHTRPIFRDIIDPNNNLHRQRLIRKIQKILKGKLLVYSANPNSPVPQLTAIVQQDALMFEDLLRSVGNAEIGYLMITSPGGDPNAAEKILMMCRQRFTKGFCVIVPYSAKSAATMICLGADKILMGYMAELGPIDPQITIDPKKPPLPARSFISGLDMIRDRIKSGENPITYLPMLAQIPPQLIAICESAIVDSKNMAEKWLKQYMLNGDHKQAEHVADLLSNGVTYKSHGKVIDFSETKNVLKLNAERIDPKTDLWNSIWELFVRSMAFFQTQAGLSVVKMFEGESVSLNTMIQLIGIPAPAANPPPQSPTQPPQTPPQAPPQVPPEAPPQAPPNLEQPIQA